MTLQNWINLNRLNAQITSNICTLGDQKYLILERKENELLLDGDSDLIIKSFEQSILIQQDIQSVLFEFGDNWYYSPIDKFKFNIFKYIGVEVNEISLSLPYLGIHGEYELCNGSRPYDEWCRKAKFLQSPSLGICEYNTLAGTLSFQMNCKAAGIKSILGETVLVSRDKEKQDTYTVKLYVKNYEGWVNLLNINAQINVFNEGFVLEEYLLEHASGLICVLMESAPLLQSYKDVFKEDVYYQVDFVEWLSADKDKLHLEKLKKYLDAFKTLIPPVLICDSYYLDKDHAHIKKILNTIGKVGFQNQSHDQYFKSIQDVYFQIEELSKDEDWPIDLLFELVNNVNELSDRCNFEIKLGELHLPQYEMTEVEKAKFETNRDLFNHLIECGFDRTRDGFIDREEMYRERVEKEVDLISRGGFIDYFLITWDILNWCRENGILCPMGRGSGAGSAVSYLLNITQLDPIKYNLLFERFLSEARILQSMPDLDNDLPSDRRDDVKRYMESRYGLDHVTSIGTYGTLKIKSIIKDLTRVGNVDGKLANYITGMIDDDLTFTEIFKEANKTPQLKQFIQDHYQIIENYPLVINQTKNMSIHAAGVVITPKSYNGRSMTVYDWLPVKKIDGILVSEWEGPQLEKAGYLKTDILGVLQLQKLSEILKLIKDNYGREVRFIDIPLDDEGVYNLFQEGYNEDVFQLGGPGLKGYCKKLKPDNIEDIIVTLALYRPGPMESGAHEKYIKIKNGEASPEYDFLTEDITKNTYGLYCVAKNTLITSKRGLVEIQNIQEGDMVLTETGEYDEVIKVLDNGIKETVRLRTSFGEELVATSDHKVLTQGGWKEIKHLTTQDLIKSWWINEEIDSIGDDRDWLLGLFLADGSSASTVAIYCCDEQFALKVRDIVQRSFPTMKGLRLRQKDNGLGICWAVELSQTEGRGNGSFSVDFEENVFNNFLKQYNMFRKTKDDKFWPEKCSLSTIAGFLEGDACFENGRVRLKSRKLAFGLYSSLQAHRIHSSFFKDSDGFWVTVFNDFNRKIPFRIKKIAINRQLGICVPRTYLPNVPPNHKYIKHSWSSVRSKLPNIPSHIVIESGGVVEHWCWAKVLSIKSNMQDHVYDLSIKTIHSFVAGGLIIHNCYQEQIMQAVQVLGGFSLAESEEVRSAMGKKIYDKMEKYKIQFVAGAIEKGCDQFEAVKIWNKLEVFAGYAFNRAHSAAYGHVGYYCQWLKFNFPFEFWSVTLNHSSDKEIARRIAEMHKVSKIKTLPPDINQSTYKFEGDRTTNEIFWSIGSIKFVGETTLTHILEERKNKGKFFSFEEFILRMKNGKKNLVDSRCMTNMILSGCFDKIEKLKAPKERLGLVKKYLCDILNRELPEELADTNNNWKDYFWILKQKELTGFGYLPFDDIYKNNIFQKIKNNRIKYIDGLSFQDEEVLGPNKAAVGVLTEVIERKMNNKPGLWALLTLNCNDENITCLFWSEIWPQYKDLVMKGKNKIVCITGEIKPPNRFQPYNHLQISELSQIIVL